MIVIPTNSAFTLWTPTVHRVFHPGFGGTDYKILHADGKVAAYVGETAIGVFGQTRIARMGRKDA